MLVIDHSLGPAPPDMYRLYDFHIGPKKAQPKPFQGGNMVLFVHSPDDDGKFQQIELGDGGNVKLIKAQGDDDDQDEDELAVTKAESDPNLLVVYVGNDKVVLDKATLNQPNFDSWTPLHSCCHTINAQEAGISILKELVAQKADLNLATKRGPGSFSCGWTPLHIACAYGLEALTIKLIRAGADVNVKNSVKWTPLFEASHRGYATVARELLKAGASHDVICPEFALCPFPGQRPLAEAARQGHSETVKVLLEWGVDKNATNKLGWTALHEAAYHSRLSIVKMLVVYGADVFAKTEKGSLAKDLTIHSEIRAMLDDLCQHGPPTTSPKKEKMVAGGDDEATTTEASASQKKSSPTKPAAARTSGPLSRKEEYALLGDLPSLDSSGMPIISIQDVDARKGDNDDEDDAKKADEDDELEAKQAGSTATKYKPKKKHHKKRGHHSHEAPPPEFKCAVSLKLLKDPLRSPYGQVFERQVIEAWFRDFGNRCPLTGEPLTPHQLVSDEKLKAQIREWKHGPRAADDAAGATESSETGTESKMVEEKPSSTAEPLETSANTDPYDF